MNKYTLSLEPVKNYAEALAVALIRNECCRWMTHNDKPLNVTQQLRFFERLKHDKKLALFICRAGDVPCGYALIKRVGRKAWLTAGIATLFRGKGFGRFVFQTLIWLCGSRQKWLEVLRTNRRAIRLYKNLGFVIRKTTRRIHVMQYDPAS